MQYSKTGPPPLDHALQMVKNGWSVIPVHDTTLGMCSCKAKGKCRSPGKHPRLSGWTKKHTTDPDRIRSWWKQWPNANIGIVTGTPSGNMVLDFDEKNGGRKTLLNLEREFPELKTTFRVRTGGGGCHLYFQLPKGGVRNSAGTQAAGMDIRGENGMVLAAGSTHYSGNTYEIEHDGPVIELPEGLLRRFWTQEEHKEDTKQEGCGRGVGTRKRTGFSADSEQVKVQIARSDNRCVATRKPQIQCESLSLSQQVAINKAIQLSIPQGPGQRNRCTFDLARRLQSVEGFEQGSTDPEILRPIVKRFHGAMMAAAQHRGFEIRGTFADTFDDFRYAWPRIHTSIDQEMASVIGRCLNAINDLPGPVSDCLDALAYADDHDTAALILLCYFLHQHWKGQGFFLSVRSGESALAQLGASKSANFQWVGRRLIQLAQDGVIVCTKQSKPGQRKTASEYAWAWGVQDQ